MFPDHDSDLVDKSSDTVTCANDVQRADDGMTGANDVQDADVF